MNKQEQRLVSALMLGAVLTSEAPLAEAIVRAAKENKRPKKRTDAPTRRATSHTCTAPSCTKRALVHVHPGNGKLLCHVCLLQWERFERTSGVARRLPA